MTTAEVARRIQSERLRLRPLPKRAASALPEDRAAAVESIGAALDAEWPLPDVVDLLPVLVEALDEHDVFGVWTVIEAATNTVVGDIGFVGAPSVEGVVEMGYSIVPSRRGRGYATEAARMLAAWALAQPGVTAITAGTDPGNVASHRVLERAGFERSGEVEGEIRWRLDRAPTRP